MEVTGNSDGAAFVFAVAGRVDTLTAPQLESYLAGQIAAGQHRLVGNLAALDYTSSAGLRVLLSALKSARQNGGDLRLAAVPAGVAKVLDMSGFTTILKSYNSVGEAVASYGTHGR